MSGNKSQTKQEIYAIYEKLYRAINSAIEQVHQTDSKAIDGDPYKCSDGIRYLRMFSDYYYMDALGAPPDDAPPWWTWEECTGQIVVSRIY